MSQNTQNAFLILVACGAAGAAVLCLAYPWRNAKTVDTPKLVYYGVLTTGFLQAAGLLYAVHLLLRV